MRCLVQLPTNVFYPIPANTQRRYNIATTSLQRRCNVVQRCCNDVVCLLGWSEDVSFLTSTIFILNFKTITSNNMKWAAPCKNLSSGICGQRRPRSNCAFEQAAHPRSLIRAFAYCKQIHCILWSVSRESKCPDETLRMCRMMWIHTCCCMFEGTFSLEKAQISAGQKL